MDEEEAQPQEAWIVSERGEDGKRQLVFHVPSNFAPEGEDPEDFQRRVHQLFDDMSPEEAWAFNKTLWDSLQPFIKEHDRAKRN